MHFIQCDVTFPEFFAILEQTLRKYWRITKFVLTRMQFYNSVHGPESIQSP